MLGVGSGIIWSFGVILSRSADHTDAFQYLLWRSVGVIAVMEVIHVMQRQRVARTTESAPTDPYRPQVIRAWTEDRWMMGANVGLFLASLMFVYAVKTTTPANAAFLSSLTPLVAVGAARFLGERVSRSTAVALVVGLVGLVLTVVGDLGAGNMLGNAAALTSCAGFSLYTVCVRSNQERDWSPSLSGYGVLMIAVCLLVTMAHGKALVPPAADITWAFIHGAVVIVVGTLMFNAASKQVPAVPMTIFAQAEMVFVPIWGFLVLDDRPAALTIVGGVVIFSAVIGKALFDASAGRRSELTTAPDLPLL